MRAPGCLSLRAAFRSELRFARRFRLPATSYRLPASLSTVCRIPLKLTPEVSALCRTPPPKTPKKDQQLGAYPKIQPAKNQRFAAFPPSKCTDGCDDLYWSQLSSRPMDSRMASTSARSRIRQDDSLFWIRWSGEMTWAGTPSMRLSTRCSHASSKVTPSIAWRSTRAGGWPI